MLPKNHLLSICCIRCLQPPTTIAEPNSSRMCLLWLSARNVFGTCRGCACSRLVHGQNRSAISLSTPTSSGVLHSSTLRANCSLLHSTFFLYPSLPPQSYEDGPRPPNHSVLCMYTYIYIERITICMCKMLPKQNQISRTTSSTPFRSLTSTSLPDDGRKNGRAEM